MARRRDIVPADSAKIRGLTILAVDPGISGACIFMAPDGSIRDFFRTPTVNYAVGAGTRRSIDCNALHDMLAVLDRRYGINVAVIEKVSAYRQGVTSAFTFGRSVGVVEGVLAAFGIIPYQVTPQQWKKHCRLIGCDKRDSVPLARRLFRELRGIRKTDTGLADAALMGLYLHQTRRGNGKWQF